MKTKILEVVTIDLQISKINPPVLVITASGHVSSPGWSGGELVPYVYIMPPADGIYEFDFVATPPSELSPQIIMPITTKYVWPNFPTDLKGIRIHASHNNLEEKISDKNEFKLLGGGEAPRGFSLNDEADFQNITLNAIVVPEKNGKRLIVHGSIITYREDDVVKITKADSPGINPIILLLRLKITEGSKPMKGTPKHFYFESTSESDCKCIKVSLIYGLGALITSDIIVVG